MKTIIKIISQFLPLVLLIPFHMSGENLPQEGEQTKSITFIMGADEEDESYFTLAYDYYSNNPNGKTDYLIDSIWNFQDFVFYLNTHPYQGKWQTINLVLHANPWTGMAIDIEKNGARATNENLVNALLSDQLTPLKTNLFDSNTTVNVMGCALGLDENIASILELALVGFETENSPKIHVTESFVTFENNYNSTIKYDSKAYFTYYKRGYKPAEIILAKKLSAAYPDSKINWRNAFSKSQSNWLGEAFSYSFHIPLVWYVPYESNDVFPAVETEIEQSQWLSKQSDIEDAAKNLGIPTDKFTWKMRKTYITNNQGVRKPAVKVIGFCTVLCVLKAEIE